LLESIKGHTTIKEAATSIGMADRTAYNMLYKIRKKYRQARDLVNTIIAYRRVDRYLDRILTLKQPLWKEIKELEQEDEEEGINHEVVHPIHS